MAWVMFKEEMGIERMSGRAGTMVFRTTATGATYAQMLPRPAKGPGTPAQQQWRKGTFKEGVAYGNAQKRDPEGIAYYGRFVAPGSFNSVYNQALADYTKPPEVRAVEVADYHGQAGAVLRVQAYDFYGVVAVHVQLLDTAGQLLEEGEAVATGSDWWEYRTQRPLAPRVVHQVQARAFDRPGNHATYTVELVAA